MKGRILFKIIEKHIEVELCPVCQKNYIPTPHSLDMCLLCKNNKPKSTDLSYDSHPEESLV